MKSLLHLLLALLALPIFAQQLTVSEPITLRNDLAYDLLGELSGRTLLLRDQGASFEVVSFDRNMQESWTKELELDKRQPKILATIPGKEHFSIIYKFRKKSNLVTKIHKYGPGANLIDSLTIKDYGYLFYNPSIRVVPSEDKSKILLYYIERQDVFRMVVFDVEKMTPLWETTIEPPEFAYYQNFRQLFINNHGDIFLVLEKNNYRNQKETHYYEFHCFLGRTKELLQFNIPMSGKLTYDATFTYDHLNDNLIGTGFYSDKNLGRADGCFYLNIPPRNHKKFLLSYNDFEDDFLLTLLGKDADKNKGVPDIEVNEAVLRRDGGVLLIGERARKLDRRSASNNRGFYDTQTRFAVDYYYEEIIAFSIHPDGRSHWSTVLHKKQYSQDDDAMFSSFFLFKTGSSLRFLFNDEVKYENTVSEYVLKGTGQFDRNSLLSTEGLKLRLRFRNALQIDKHTLIIPSESRSRLKLVKLEY
jgi:hypothetical protein